MVTLFTHQEEALARTADCNKVAFYHDMGLGKTFTGSEKMLRLGGRVNLVICQKSKIDDWLEHFKQHYRWYKKDISANEIFDLTKKDEFGAFIASVKLFCGQAKNMTIGIINYDLVFRRPELLKLKIDTLMLDESSMIQNDKAKRTKAILRLDAKNVILLSGTPTGGKYERLYSQLKLLGWEISKTQYYSEFVITKLMNMGGFKIPVVTGYKNVGRLKRKMRQYGCDFLKTEDVFDMPAQTFLDISVKSSNEYKKFKKSKIVEIGETELVGDTTLTDMLYQRQLCGIYSAEKFAAFTDLLNSTEDRLIVFYNFTAELERLRYICEEHDRPVSEVNGQARDLDAFENDSNSVTLIQYQAGAMGLNLQKANKIVYFTPPLCSELYEQSKKRIHRIGQEKPCFYYRLTCEGSIENRIYSTLGTRHDFTEKLFLRG